MDGYARNSHTAFPLVGAFLVCILRFILQAIIVNKTAKDLNDRRRYYWSLPVFDVLQPLQSLRWKLYCLFRKKSEFLRK